MCQCSCPYFCDNVSCDSIAANFCYYSPWSGVQSIFSAQICAFAEYLWPKWQKKNRIHLNCTYTVCIAKWCQKLCKSFVLTTLNQPQFECIYLCNTHLSNKNPSLLFVNFAEFHGCTKISVWTTWTWCENATRNWKWIQWSKLRRISWRKQADLLDPL